jgi:adenine-specific DNA-methyltransferase
MAGMPRKPALKLQTSTLWYYPSQQYEGEPQGTPSFQGATPSYVIWNLLSRYTREGDLVVDPFCGGGTTLDVARELGRKALGYDLAPQRKDIFRADARELPLEDGVADFVFMDPPYSTHLEYSDDPRCIGKLDAFGPQYLEAMAAVFDEVARVLRERRLLAVYVGDSFKKGQGFAGLGAQLYGLLAERFRPIDHVAVVRGNRTLEKPGFARAAVEGNFFLRGFNHLLIFKQERSAARGAVEESAQRKAPRRKRRSK